MSTEAKQICIEVLSLPRKTRAEIAERILSSLEDRSSTVAEGRWRALIRQRRAEVRSGKVRLRPAAEVMQKALRAVA
jgi:hypothetical protein